MPPQLDDQDWDDDDDLAGGYDDEDEETPTVPCPHCQRAIPDFADRCPYCGDWVVQGGVTTTSHKPWIIIAAILALVGFLLAYAL